MVRDSVQSLMDEPNVPNPPTRVWRDWALLAVLVPTAVLEAIFRTNLPLPGAAVGLGLVSIVVVMWRRTNPLMMVVIAFTAQLIAEIIGPGRPAEPAMVYASAVVLLLPYALCRWGSGRQAAAGMGIIVGGHLLNQIGNPDGIGEGLFGFVVLILVGVLGASVRFRASSRVRAVDEIKLRERELLARELHDSVAHHVSAIAIQAQAGRTVAGTDPAAAVDTLRRIEAEASRTLSEMRTMVGALRHGEAAELTPQRGVADIDQLAERRGDAPSVFVERSGDLVGLARSLDTALYRMAQESITNATRHGRKATRIDVAIVGEPEYVRLDVIDDGEATSFGGGAPGYGIVGMTERATLLGGTLIAGVRAGGGWQVTAVLPRSVLRT